MDERSQKVSYLLITFQKLEKKEFKSEKYDE